MTHLKTADYVYASARPCLHLDIHTGAPSSGTQSLLDVHVWGQSGACVKEQGCHVLASEHGEQRACQRGLNASGTKWVNVLAPELFFFNFSKPCI